ncbi:hypothetical protein GE21DRAFT_7146 [Neurospora crassa]|uniref:NIMA interactive protein n=2 Tax=Neurospora crassa TaxID=5141 RepID=Q1K666_NEUCR|nr:NIMA interactive protein [Neurospora crassa OR74A]EAA29433.1 NIMA interactive protein [Neurospora crassa OR74A]KHE78470.1 hypothetical protein GE21DRAFT_7146 [Neurospora crassa]CAD70764.1 hypothetical protein [Neurospora crassa]|eukprot:XP_958669.1 NIMA interactive protein [Neurospora crassa OR74A]
MIISDNLRTASIYINNQLLSRGLLRDGDTIDFAYPGDNDDELAHTMGRIMGVVNDLILRRDRDAETRESLSQTLRSLRAESLRQSTDIVRLSDKLTDSARKTALAEQETAHARAQLKAAEQTVARLKEEAARQKSLVQQTRNACANEIRKRDRMIEGLKKAVADAGRTRGTGHTRGASRDGGMGSGLGGVMSIVVQAGEEYNAEAGGKMGVPQGMTGSEGYDLRMETNGFLAELAKGLSEENEVLLGLVRRTVKRMQEMSGWDVVANVVVHQQQQQQQQQKDEGGDTNMEGGGELRKEEDEGEKHALVIPTSCEELQRDLENVLEHMRIILTNPSFVPIEEVVVREDEIHRLRDGWVKMESRWKEAVHLIDGWRNRMQVSGKAVNVEELKMGLRLSPVKVKNVAETAHGLQLEMPSVREEEDAEEQADREDIERYLEKEKADAATAAAAAASMNASIPRSRDSSLHLVPAPLGGVPDDPMDEDSEQSSIFEDDDIDLDDLEDDDEEPNVEVLGHSLMLSSPPLPVPPQLSPLKDSPAAGNRGGFGQPNLRRGGGDYTNDLRAVEVGPPVPPHADRPQQTKKSIRPVRQEDDDASVSEREPSRPSTAPSATSPGSIKLVKAEAYGPKAASAARKRPGTATTVPTGPTTRTRSRTRTAESDREAPAPAAPVTRSRAREEAATSGGTGRTQTTAARKAAADRSKPPITRAAPFSTAPGARSKSQTRSLTSSGKSKETESKTGPKFAPGHRRTNSEKTTYSNASGPGTPGREREVAGSNSRPTTSSGLTKTREATLLAQSPKLAPSPRFTKGLATANNSENGSSTDSANRSGGGAISQSPIIPNRSPKRTGNSRLPLPRTGLVNTAALQAQQSPLNVAAIAAKLAASEREADAARVRAKLKAMKRSKQESVGPSQSQRSANGASQRQSKNQSQGQSQSQNQDQNQNETQSKDNQNTNNNGRATPMDCDDNDENELIIERRRAGTPRGRQDKTPKTASRAAREQEAELFDFEQEDEEVDELAGPENHHYSMGMGMEKLHVQKRKREKMRTSRTASRRRSTLNPWELQSLLQGSVNVPPLMPPPPNPMTAGMGMAADVGMEG